MANDDSPPSILDKAFALLGAFSAERRVLTLSEIGRASGLPKSTVHRLLARLVELGAIEHHRSGYRVGMTLLQIGATTPAMSMRDVASPHLAALHHGTGSTVHFAVLRQFDIVVLDRISRRPSPTSASGMGARLPANCTALGKALLAHEDLDDLEMFLPQPMPAMTPQSINGISPLISELREVRRVGLAHESGQAVVGLSCVAAPVIVMGSAVGALSLAHPTNAVLSINVEATLREAAARISKEVLAALREGRVAWFPNEIDRAPLAESRPYHRVPAANSRGHHA